MKGKTEILIYLIIFFCFFPFSCKDKKDIAGRGDNEGGRTVDISNEFSEKNIYQKIEFFPNIEINKIIAYAFTGEKKEEIKKYDYFENWEKCYYIFKNGNVVGMLPVNNSKKVLGINLDQSNFEIFFINLDKKIISYFENIKYSLFWGKHEKKQMALIMYSKREDENENNTINYVLLIDDKGEKVKEYNFKLSFFPDTLEVPNNGTKIYFNCISLGHVAEFEIDPNNYELKKNDERTFIGY